MGSQERNRRRQIIVAIISMTMPLPVHQVKAWEPVHIDRTHVAAKTEAAKPVAAMPPTATAQAATAQAATAQAATAQAAPVPAAGPLMTGQVATKITAEPGYKLPATIKPVKIEEPTAAPIEPSDEFEAALNGAWEPVKTASKGGRKPIDPIRLDDPALTIDSNLHTDWAANSGDAKAASSVAPTKASPGDSKISAITQGPFKPLVIEDHFAAEDHLEMLGGNGTATPIRTPLASATAPAIAAVPTSATAPGQSPMATGVPLPTKAASPHFANTALPQAPIGNGVAEPNGTALASASLIQNTPKPRPAEGNASEPLPAPVGQAGEQPLVANGMQAQGYSISRVEALELALQRNPNIRVLAKTPQIASTDITTADAFFDPFFRAGIVGAKQDQQLTDTLQSFGGTFTENQRDSLLPLGGVNNLAIGQQLRGGGSYEVGVGTIYENFDRVGDFRLVNPAWLSAINMRYEQPLFEGRGRAIGESLIEIARINNRQSNDEFRAQVNIILRDAEVAYWTLALLEQQAIAYRMIIEKSEQQLTGETDRLDLGDSILPDVLESRDQYTEFLTFAANIETQRRNAVQQLANLLGYTPEQAAQLRTRESERPTTDLPSYEEGVARLMLRPELEAQRSAIRRSEVELRRQINTLQPDLRMVVDYAITGLDTDLAGSMETVADNDFHYAALGFVLQQPIGRRAEFAQVRRANITLCQERERLEALQHQYTHQLQGIYAQLQAQAEVIRLSQDRVKIAEEQYTLRLTLRNEGEGDLDSVLRTQQRLAIAQTAVNEAVYRYQQLLVLWQYEQGAIGDERVAVSQ